MFKGKKRKEKENEIPIEVITHSELASFFQEDKFFNTTFLELDLQIPPKYHPLFFDYCDAQQIEKSLLKHENQLLLIDTLVGYSKEFLEALKQDPSD